MTLDEAITLLKFNNKHIADLKNDDLQQIAEWLEELKILKLLKNCSFMTIGKTVEQFEQEIRNKAIDDFAELLRGTRDNRTLRVNCDDLEIRHMTKRLKRGDRE